MNSFLNHLDEEPSVVTLLVGLFLYTAVSLLHRMLCMSLAPYAGAMSTLELQGINITGSILISFVLYCLTKATHLNLKSTRMPITSRIGPVVTAVAALCLTAVVRYGAFWYKQTSYESTGKWTIFATGVIVCMIPCGLRQRSRYPILMFLLFVACALMWYGQQPMQSNIRSVQAQRRSWKSFLLAHSLGVIACLRAATANRMHTSHRTNILSSVFNINIPVILLVIVGVLVEDSIIAPRTFVMFRIFRRHYNAIFVFFATALTGGIQEIMAIWLRTRLSLERFLMVMAFYEGLAWILSILLDTSMTARGGLNWAGMITNVVVIIVYFVKEYRGGKIEIGSMLPM